MSTIRVPPQLADAVDEDDYPERLEWLAALPDVVDQIATDWQLELGDPFEPGGHCAWVAPARNPAGDELVLNLTFARAVRPACRPGPRSRRRR